MNVVKFCLAKVLIKTLGSVGLNMYVDSKFLLQLNGHSSVTVLVIISFLSCFAVFLDVNLLSICFCDRILCFFVIIRTAMTSGFRRRWVLPDELPLLVSCSVFFALHLLGHFEIFWTLKIARDTD